MQATLNVLYKTIKTKRKKERFETILEPLQALLQIAYLSFTPIGTKLTIHNNILYIQPPNYSQSIVRWYNNDTQEDLFYLFNIFYRFKKFYCFLQNSSNSAGNIKDRDGSTNVSAFVNIVNRKLYELLIELAKNGIGNLIRTYGQTEKIHILHTLKMYKNILVNDSGSGSGSGSGSVNQNSRLENYELENLVVSNSSHDTQKQKTNINNHTSDSKPSKTFSLMKNMNKTKIQNQMMQDDDSDEVDDDGNNTNETKETKETKEIKDNSFQKNSNSNKTNDSISTKKIDDVFIRITDIYTQEIYNVIYNTLILMEQNDTSYNTIIEGLNKILEPTNIKIKKWIDENIVF